MSIDGYIKFATKWVEVYRAEIEGKISADYEGKEDAIRISPQSHYKKIAETDTGAFFVIYGRIVTDAGGELSSASLVDAELDEMLKDQLKGIDLTKSQIRSLKQRIQKQHLTLISALEHFGLFEIETRTGPNNTSVNFYAITKKGETILPTLE